MSFLQVAQIEKKEETFHLKDISFEQGALQNIVVAGATGSGKSTLLKIIAGLAQPDAGRVLFEGKKIVGPEEQLIPGHRHIAYLSQYFELRNNYRVKDELDYTNELSNAVAHHIFEVCRITHLLHRWTHQLSGGEKQRIAMARQLIKSPKLFLLDEPFSNLDRAHKNVVKSVIADISAALNITCMLVSHDPTDILPWADELLVLSDGALIQKGPPQEVYTSPANAYAAGLLGAYNLIGAEGSQAFEGKFLNIPAGKSLLVRPEQFKITLPGENAVKGLVKKVLYFGSWHQIEVNVNGIDLIVKTDEVNFSVGDSIHLAISEQDLWFV